MNKNIKETVLDLCEEGDLRRVLLFLESLPEKHKVGAIMLCAQRALAKNLQIFWEIAKLLFPSYWFVKLMCLSIYSNRHMWRNFYEAALSAIDQISLGYRSISYATLSQPIADLSSLEAIKIINKALNLLPFSYEDLAGGTAIILCDVLPKINSKAYQYTLTLANIVSSLPAINVVSKIDILSRLAIIANNINIKLADELVERILKLIPRVDPLELIEVEIVAVNLLSKLYKNREDELLELAKKSDSEKLSKIVRMTLMRMIKDLPDSGRDRDVWREHDDVLNELQDVLKRRAELKKRLSRELDKILKRRSL
ncbi:MAG: hypothetical protein NDP13_03175 [Crenarchaeota archaeon]|nr:hypothetical protein [Thermoproteota archaeon]MCR8455204.1 hypothetical protein [Thermoproteota archaeon]MCR8500885.1 hypothetical protein [Thermoproteota archaeon]